MADHKDKTALLTGYKGFIGRNLHKELIDQGYNVSLIEKYDIEILSEEDVTDLVESMVVNVDIVLHNGAIADTSLQDYGEMLYYNYLFSKKLIDACKKHSKKIIFAGSASVYGNDDYPQNIYAWSKMITEEYGRASYPEGFTSLRYFNVFGPGEENKGKMASVAYQAYKKGSFELFPGKPVRDFIYVKDVVNANMMAIECECGVYDVGYANAVGFETFMKIMNIPYTYTSKDEIPSWYQFYTCADKNKWVPNWEPKYSASTGCEDYKKYLDNNG
jgi:ADP-L-glycero-D-manno-heptose 6-epimerase